MVFVHTIACEHSYISRTHARAHARAHSHTHTNTHTNTHTHTHTHAHVLAQIHLDMCGLCPWSAENAAAKSHSLSFLIQVTFGVLCDV